MDTTLEDSRLYEHTNDEALAIGQAAYRYIQEGVVEGLPLGFRGAAVYGVASMLREHDSELHGEATLSEDQQARLEEIESEMELAIEAKMQFFPFGHDYDPYEDADLVSERAAGREYGNWLPESRHNAGSKGSSRFG